MSIIEIVNKIRKAFNNVKKTISIKKTQDRANLLFEENLKK